MRNIYCRTGLVDWETVGGGGGQTSRVRLVTGRPSWCMFDVTGRPWCIGQTIAITITFPDAPFHLDFD